jgi:integrase
MSTFQETNPLSKSKHKPRTKPPARSTLHDEIVTVRMVLKTAIRHGWLEHLPDLSPPYTTQGKVVHRPWFSPEEYKQLYEAARAYAKEPLNGRFKWNAELVYDFILFMANTGLRPDEAFNLQHRDVTIATDAATGSEILEIEVRGKRGVGHCKSMPGAVRVYQRLLARPKPVQGETRRQRQQRRKEGGEPPPPPAVEYPKPTDLLFPGNHILLFNNLLDRIGLKLDRDGKPRTAFSGHRLFASRGLTGTFETYGMLVEPSARLYALRERENAYTDSLGLLRAARNFDRPRQRRGQVHLSDRLDIDGGTRASCGHVRRLLLQQR